VVLCLRLETLHQFLADFPQRLPQRTAISIVPQGEPANQLDGQSILKHVEDSRNKWLI
jgi:hypothetical protein